MNKITIIATLFFIVLAFLIFMKEDTKSLSYEVLKDDAIILAFGDSLTYGFGASSEFSYPYMLGKKSSLKVINAGVNGEFSAEGLERLGEYLKQKPSLVILCHGGNDILNNLSHVELKSNLLKMINLIKNTKAEILLVGVPDFNTFSFAPPSLYEDVAEETGVLFEDEVLTYIELHRSLKSDYVHPNEKGYEMMADSFMEILLKNGLL
ncbi:MAG: GDSL-type esterase/lipase family protein [Campylobacterota bacterium]|nr:GDSL-type esterase/lipase family protein [Campylobacterota bacterium]